MLGRLFAFRRGQPNDISVSLLVDMPYVLGLVALWRLIALRKVAGVA